MSVGFEPKPPVHKCTYTKTTEPPRLNFNLEQFNKKHMLNLNMQKKIFFKLIILILEINF